MLVGFGLRFLIRSQRPRVCHVDIKQTMNEKNLHWFISMRISFLAATTTHRRHRTPPKRAFMLVFGVLTFSGHGHNDDDAENRGDG